MYKKIRIYTVFNAILYPVFSFLAKIKSSKQNLKCLIKQFKFFNKLKNTFLLKYFTFYIYKDL